MSTLIPWHLRETSWWVSRFGIFQQGLHFNFSSEIFAFWVWGMDGIQSCHLPSA
jgi:hypothetical protein